MHEIRFNEVNKFECETMNWNCAMKVGNNYIQVKLKLDCKM